jgi:serine/threonine-protein kinase PknG
VTATMAPCQQPGCAGHYLADGYCDECGHKAPATAGPVTGGSATAGPATFGGSTVSGATITAATVGGTGTGRTGGLTRTTRTAGRGRLGANLVVVPPVPLRDPATAVLKDPKVPESQRFCGKCGEPVGRGRPGTPGRVEGFCPHDRTPFNFRPRLSPGDLVDDRYEILGALAHGGLGWIYLARDRNLRDSGAERWVVLKGLINTGDPDAMAAAMAERRFLVEVDHPNIVKIYDFAQHPDPDTGAMVGYIVMEYVGGRSLKDLALSRTGPGGKRVPLPLDQVLAYGIEVLPALGYLHSRGYLYCDLKPDNLIHAEEQLKLIDMGAVRRMDDHISALWGTPGYQAPEVPDRGASVASDIYTVGRTMAVLSFDFTGFASKYAASLPQPATVPLFAEQESYYRLLQRATDTNPDRRFPSAGEMAEQCVGVLREILSVADRQPRPDTSSLFTPERSAFGTGAAESTLDGPSVAAALPLTLVDPSDPAAGYLATIGGGDPAATIATLRAAPPATAEVRYRLVRALVEIGDTAAAWDELAALGSLDSAADWRRDWHAGLVALHAGRMDQARKSFDRVYSALPGEPAAQLALGAACELMGDRDGAGRRYWRVWRVDHGFVSAAFGLARMLLAGGDRAAALEVLDEVPDSSSHYVEAQIAAVRAGLDRGPGVPTEADLVGASTRLQRLRLDQEHRASLAVELLHIALDWLDSAGPASPSPAGRPVAKTVPVPRVSPAVFLGYPLSERDVRLGLERAYRQLATLEHDALARYALVDAANMIRPRTVV